MTLISIVTPTIPGRESLLLDRCMPSVMGQAWEGPIEHVIVSDRNPELAREVESLGLDHVRLVQINDLWRNEATIRANGAFPWMVGGYLAFGDFIGFLGDDDELLDHHVATHVNAMTDAGAMWSLSKVDFQANGEHWNYIGDDSFAEGHLDATGIMCYREALRHATWDPASGNPAVDWLMVHRWRQIGLVGTFIDDVTAIHHDGWLVGKTGQPYD